MSNTHQFARIGLKKFSHEFDVHDVYKVGIKGFGLRRPKWVKQPTARSYRRKKSFSWTLRISCLESRNQTFLGSGGENESNTHQFARIGEKKISHEFDVHDVGKVGIKRFWALTPISSLESAWKNFLMNSTYKSNVFGLRRPKWVKQPIARPNRPEENFSWTRRTSCLQSRKQTFLGQEAEMSLIPIKSLESAKENFSWTGRTWCLESRNETFLSSGGRNGSNTE